MIYLISRLASITHNGESASRGSTGDVEVAEFERHELDAVLALERAAFGADAYPARTFLRSHRARNQRFLVAIYEGDVVGYIMYWLGRSSGYIVSMAIRSALRRTGIGSTLLRRAIDEMSESGLTSVRLHVSTTNGPALSLYEKHGFAGQTVERRYYADGTDALEMALALPASAPD